MATFLERVADKFIGDRMEMEVGRLYSFLSVLSFSSLPPCFFSLPPCIAFISLITPRYFSLVNISSGFLRPFQRAPTIERPYSSTPSRFISVFDSSHEVKRALLLIDCPRRKVDVKLLAPIDASSFRVDRFVSRCSIVFLIMDQCFN